MNNICKNCGAEFSGTHCPMCGQAANVERFTVREILRGLYLAFSVADNTFYRTARSLFTRPGHMVREYLIGERVNYLKPVKMLMVLVAVYIIIENWVLPAGNDDLGLNKLSFLGAGVTYISKFFQNDVYGTLFKALLCALPFTWLFGNCKIHFKDGKEDSLNLAEHFYALVYLSCQRLFISIIWIPVFLISGYKLGSLENNLLAVVLYAWCYKQLLGISWGKAIWKVLLGLIIALGSLIALLLVIVLVAIIFDPSIMTTIRQQSL